MKTKPQRSFSSVLPVLRARRPPLISGRGCLSLRSKRGGNRWRPSSALDSPFARIRMQNALARQETSCDENTHREGEREGEPERRRRKGSGWLLTHVTTDVSSRFCCKSRAQRRRRERGEWMQFSTDDDGDVEEEETFSAESSSLGGRSEPGEDEGGEGGEEGTEKEETWTTAKLKLQQHQIGSSHEVRRGEIPREDQE